MWNCRHWAVWLPAQLLARTLRTDGHKRQSTCDWRPCVCLLFVSHFASAWIFFQDFCAKKSAFNGWVAVVGRRFGSIATQEILFRHLYSCHARQYGWCIRVIIVRAAENIDDEVGGNNGGNGECAWMGTMKCDSCRIGQMCDNKKILKMQEISKNHRIPKKLSIFEKIIDFRKTHRISKKSSKFEELIDFPKVHDCFWAFLRVSEFESHFKSFQFY